MALLPPANEVWGKVIFSQACVKNSVHSGREGASSGESAPGGVGAWSRGGGLVRGVPGGDPPPVRLLLQAVRILLECILIGLGTVYLSEQPKGKSENAEAPTVMVC